MAAPAAAPAMANRTPLETRARLDTSSVKVASWAPAHRATPSAMPEAAPAMGPPMTAAMRTPATGHADPTLWLWSSPYT